MSTYQVQNINIEFLKDYNKESNSIQNNKYYNFQLLENNQDTYQPVEFTKKDPLGYLKIKNYDLWLYENDKSGYIDYIHYGYYSTIQPLVLWFDYIQETQFLVYKIIGYGIEHIMKTTYDKSSNVLYLNYEEINNKIYIKWVIDKNLATKFIYKIINLQDLEFINKKKIDVIKKNNSIKHKINHINNLNPIISKHKINHVNNIYSNKLLKHKIDHENKFNSNKSLKFKN